MLTLLEHRSGRSCDGVSRRDFVQAGTLALGGLSLPWLFEQQAVLADAAGASRSGRPSFVRDKAIVLLFLSGGASHIETFNPNMDAPAPYCSMTGEVTTSLPGVSFGGTFPQLAQHAHEMAVVRSFQHPITGHVEAIVHMLTGGTDPVGKRKTGFSMGSVCSRLAGRIIRERGCRASRCSTRTRSIRSIATSGRALRMALSRIRSARRSGHSIRAVGATPSAT